MSLGRALLQGSLQQAVFTGLTVLSQVVFAALIARLVAPESFGLFALAMAFNELLSVWTDYGAAASLSRRSVLSRRLLAGVAAPMLLRAVGAVMVAGLLAAAYQLVEPTGGLVAVSVAVVVAGTLGQFGLLMQAVSESQLAFARVAVGEAAAYWLSTLLVTLPLALAGFEAWALVVGFGCTGLVRALWHVPAVRRLPLAAEVEPDAPQFGRHLTHARVLNAGVLQSDRLVLATTGTIGVVGVYARAQSLAGQVSTTLGAVFDRVLYPALARVHARADGMLAEHFHRIVGLVLLGSVPLAVALASVSTPLFALLFGDRWLAGAPVFAIAMAALPALSVIRVCDTLARAAGRADRSAAMKAVYLVALLPALALGTLGGARGVATALFVTAVLMMGVQLRDATVTAGARVGAAGVLFRRVAPLGLALLVGGIGVALVTRLAAGDRGPLAIALPMLAVAVTALGTIRLEAARAESVVSWMVAPIAHALPLPARRLLGVRAG